MLGPQPTFAWITGSVIVLYLLRSLFKGLRVSLNSDLRKIPGPWLSSFSYWPLKLAVLGGNRTTYIHGLHAEFGPFVRISPTEIAVADIDAWRQIHRIGSDFRKNSLWYQGQSPVQYNDDTCGVFGLVDPKKASARRRLFQTAGTKQIVIEWEPQIKQCVDSTIEKIEHDLKQGQCDVMKWWTFMTADVLGDLAFGESFECVQNEEKSQMVKDIEASMPLIGVRLEFRWLFDLLIMTPLPQIKQFLALFGRFQEYGQLAVENTRKASKGLTKTLFSKMVPEDGSQQLPDSLIEQECANVLIAGTDTTAMTLTYLVYAVLKDDAIRRKLVAEVQAGPENPTWEQLESMPYLNNVIQETWRWQPAIPGSLPRVVPPKGAVFGKLFVPADTIVSTQAWTFHHDPNVFEQPFEFNPDRWLNTTREMKEHMMVFGGPARVCVGQNIARLELLHAVSKFFRDCGSTRLSASTTEESMQMVDYFAIKPKAGVCLIEPA